jgi:translation initiation factor 2 subunit 2
MSESQADAERKPRKSVAFSEGATIVDSDGQVTESKEVNGGKSTAESHGEDSSRGETTYTHVKKQGLTSGVTGDADKEVEEVTDMFADLAKKVRPYHHETTKAEC